MYPPSQIAQTIGSTLLMTMLYALQCHKFANSDASGIRIKKKYSRLKVAREHARRVQKLVVRLRSFVRMITILHRSWSAGLLPYA